MATSGRAVCVYLLQVVLILQSLEIPGECAGGRPVVLAEDNVVAIGSEGDARGGGGDLLFRQLMASAPIPASVQHDHQHYQYRFLDEDGTALPVATVTSAAENVSSEEALDGPTATLSTSARRSVGTDEGTGSGRPRPTGVEVAALGGSWRPEWQLPFFVILFAAVGFLAITFVVLLWLKNQMLSSQGGSGRASPGIKSGAPTGDGDSTGAGGRWVFHPVLQPPSPLEAHVQQAEEKKASLPPTPTPTPEPVTITKPAVPPAPASDPATPVRRCVGSGGRIKGLLERRGSSASLTIELHPSSHGRTDGHVPVVTPTRECTTDEFLLSAGNVLSRRQLRASLRDVRALHREFWELPSNHPERAYVAGSGTKNRYRSILPNERTRVCLPPASPLADPLTTYINANYVRGFDSEEKAYIATQGPLPHTVSDFWLMVWSEGSTVIVMITKLWEKGRPKCERYFPEDEADEPSVYGDIEVRITATCPRDGYTLRELIVTRGDETRRILHLWYDTWPDHATPSSAQALVAMASEVAEYRQVGSGDPPVVVHCSAGIGRTGCFIAVAVGMAQLLHNDNVDILGIVCQMRYDRGGMIQTAEQYEFVHRALCLFEGSLPDQSGE
ncbi:tyrosine-protein phosphatase non-receptor type 7-like isoform X1 [Schistocerca americana]|uniref:protein-tyrosine-phosphatase n=1 Tax=Schistocerca gregaria TaxID=7010 RepID=A0A8E5JTA7_SCHGR|nr:tyrosine-protein phosphatase non-receptor type 7-like isoform X1 [Schistocerca americana]XP_047097279.1 tyrosine-protein phosphatase non-receptor type 7-like [Schistocerca piceifrons]XP_049941367.1 tyrosine-protein phosphatase non-receptor type 7-like isoform X1 [Schistocerca serialis cubense]QVD39467.1 Tyrosine-protein phosphatase non-receptor type 5-like protein [Schistocerca gregaria]